MVCSFRTYIRLTLSVEQIQILNALVKAPT